MKMNGRSVSSLLLPLLLLVGNPVAADLVATPNVHAMVRVLSCETNTIISVPWVFYTPNGSAATNLPIDRLVRPTNLTTNDYVLAHLPSATKSGGVYMAWQLKATEELVPNPSKDYPASETNVLDLCWTWEPVLTVNRLENDNNGSTRSDVWMPETSGTNTACRGFGVWLLRQNPVEADGVTAKPFYLYGQWTANDASVTIPGGSNEKPVCTMLANPDCTQETDVNKLSWNKNDIGPDDTLILPTGSKTTLYCTFQNGEWGYSKQTLVKKGSVNIIKTERVPAPCVPAGTGFWYVRRREGPLSLTWALASASCEVE